MSDFEFGPVELILAGFDGDQPNLGVISAVMDLVDAGTVRLLDLVFVSRSETGELNSMEIEEAPDSLGLSAMELSAGGLAATEDLEQMAGQLQPGTSAILLAIEFVWAKHLASRLAEAGGFVIDSLRIPAPVVNAVVAEARVKH